MFTTLLIFLFFFSCTVLILARLVNPGPARLSILPARPRPCLVTNRIESKQQLIPSRMLGNNMTFGALQKN